MKQFLMGILVLFILFGTLYATTDTIGASTSQTADSTDELHFGIITAASSGTLQTVGVNIEAYASGHVQMGIWDSGGNLLCTSPSTVMVNGWVDTDMSSCSLSITPQDYYIGWDYDAGSTIYFGSTTSGFYWEAQTYGSMPSTLDFSHGNYRNYNMRMTYTAAPTTTTTTTTTSTLTTTSTTSTTTSSTTSTTTTIIPTEYPWAIQLTNVSLTGALTANYYGVNSIAFTYYPYKISTASDDGATAFWLNQTFGGIITDLQTDVPNLDYIPPSTQLGHRCSDNWAGGFCFGDINYTADTKLSANVNASGTVIVASGVTLTTNGFALYVSGNVNNLGEIDTGVNTLTSGSGGTGGGGNGGNSRYGVYIQANTIKAGVITDNGITGDAGTGVNEAGGGGGGGGGLILLAYSSGGSLVAGTYNVSGGYGGTHATGTGSYNIGGDGGDTQSAGGTYGKPAGNGGTPSAPSVDNANIQTWFAAGWAPYFAGAGGGGGCGYTASGNDGSSFAGSYGGSGAGGGGDCSSTGDDGGVGGAGRAVSYQYSTPPLSVISPMVYSVKQVYYANTLVQTLTLAVNMTSISNTLTVNSPIIQYFPNLAYLLQYSFPSRPQSWKLISQPTSMSHANITNTVWFTSNSATLPVNVFLTYPFTSFNITLKNNPSVQTSLALNPFLLAASNTLPSFPSNREVMGVNTFIEFPVNELNTTNNFATTIFLNNFTFPSSFSFPSNQFSQISTMAGIYAPEGNYENPSITLIDQTILTSSSGYVPRVNNPFDNVTSVDKPEFLSLYLPSNGNTTVYTMSVYGCSGFATNDILVAIRGTSVLSGTVVQTYRITQVPFTAPFLGSFPYGFEIYTPSEALTFTSPFNVWGNPISIYANAGCGGSVPIISLPSITVSCNTVSNPSGTATATCTGNDAKALVTGWNITFINQTTLLTKQVMNVQTFTGNYFIAVNVLPSNTIGSYYAIIQAHVGTLYDPSWLYFLRLNLAKVQLVPQDFMFVGIFMVLLPVTLAYYNRVGVLLMEMFVIVMGQAISVFSFSAFDLSGFLILCGIILVIDEMVR